MHGARISSGEKQFRLGGGGVKAQEMLDECVYSRAATIHRFIDIS